MCFLNSCECSAERVRGEDAFLSADPVVFGLSGSECQDGSSNVKMQKQQQRDPSMAG